MGVCVLVRLIQDERLGRLAGRGVLAFGYRGKDVEVEIKGQRLRVPPWWIQARGHQKLNIALRKARKGGP